MNPRDASSLRLIAIIAVLCASPIFGHAQSKIDVSQCFNSVLKTVEHSSFTTKFRYYYLSLINQSNYEQIKQDASITALLPAGLFDGDFHNFDEKRSSYFRQENVSLEYFHNSITSKEYIPEAWKSVISNCIDDVTRVSGYGVMYAYSDDDPYIASLELKYRSTEVNQPYPHVRSWALQNADVIGHDGKPVPMYRECYSHHFDFTCPRLDDPNVFILKRQDPNKPIYIALSLDNNSQSTRIEIPVLPRKQSCTVTYPGQEISAEPTKVEIHNAPSQLLPEYWGGDNQQLYLITVDYPGEVQSATCDPQDSFNNIMSDAPNQRDRWMNKQMKRNPDWEGNRVRCLGRTNTSNQRYTYLYVKYKMPVTQCVDIPWK